VSLKISLGGDLVQYLGVYGLLKALDEESIENVEFHCSGFSCIPLIIWKSNKQIAYNIICNMWDDALKLFKEVSKPSLEDMSKSIFLLYKLQKKVNKEDSRKKLSEFVQKWIPSVDITQEDNIKVHAFNILNNADEILTGNSQEILMKALPYPFAFTPIDSYLSLSWVFGIPQGDVIIYIDWLKPFKPQKATDYLLMATCARTSKIIEITSKNAQTVLRVELSNSNDIASIVRKFYIVGKELTKMNFNSKN